MTSWRLVCDVGGTNIRIARSEGPKNLINVSVQSTARFSSLQDALIDYCRTFDDRDSLSGAAIAAAGPVEGGRVALTNGHMTIERDAIMAELDGRPVALLNDLEATAYAVGLLSAADAVALVVAEDSKSGPRLVVNVGTGFGAALLIETASGWHCVATEAGHMTLGAVGQTGAIRTGMSDVVSVEDKLSGLALCAATNNASGESPFSQQYGELFGAVCGNLVLATGAWGGVYLCGSVASAWCQTGDLAAFTAAFRNKGRMSRQMARVQVSQMLMPHPALVGLTTLDVV